MCRSVSCVDKAPDPSYLPCEERWTECSRWRFAVRSSCCHSDSDSLCDSRWSLVMKTYGSTLCTRVHNAREYTMHESTQCMRVHSAREYTMHESTQRTRVHNAWEYTVHESTQCMRVHNAREYTMYTIHENTQCTRVHNAREYTMHESTQCSTDRAKSTWTQTASKGCRWLFQKLFLQKVDDRWSASCKMMSWCSTSRH